MNSNNLKRQDLKIITVYLQTNVQCRMISKEHTSSTRGKNLFKIFSITYTGEFGRAVQVIHN